MRNETLIKVVIAVFGIILIVLATFIYGNFQRSKQKTASNPTPQQTQSPTTTSNTQPNQSAQAPAQTTPAQPAQTPAKPTTPAPAPAPAAKPAAPATPAPVAASTPAKAHIPATGGEGTAAAIMTVLAVLGYTLFRQRKYVVSKSQLH